MKEDKDIKKQEIREINKKIKNGKSQLIKLKNQKDTRITYRKKLLKIVEDFYAELYRSTCQKETHIIKNNFKPRLRNCVKRFVV